MYLRTMAQDRFVYFTQDSTPSIEEVRLVLTNFLGGAGEVTYSVDRFFVSLPGKPTLPFKGLPGVTIPPIYYPEERWIEVWYGDDPRRGIILDIMTRHGDEFTDALADQIAKMFARYWKGRAELD